MTRRDDALEWMLAAVQAVRDESGAVTASGSALARLRDAVREADRVEQPGESERGRRLRAAALSVDLADPDLVGQLSAALADPEAALDWHGVEGAVELPQTIIGKGSGALLPAGECLILSGAGGGCCRARETDHFCTGIDRSH